MTRSISDLQRMNVVVDTKTFRCCIPSMSLSFGLQSNDGLSIFERVIVVKVFLKSDNLDIIV